MSAVRGPLQCPAGDAISFERGGVSGSLAVMRTDSWNAMQSVQCDNGWTSKMLLRWGVQGDGCVANHSLSEPELANQYGQSIEPGAVTISQRGESVERETQQQGCGGWNRALRRGSALGRVNCGDHGKDETTPMVL